MSLSRKHADDLRGAAKLAVVATTGVIDIVEEMHRVIASGPSILGRPLQQPARALTRVCYAPVRGVAKLVGTSLDVALSRLERVLGESVPSRERDAFVSALNGVLGDYLAETGNPLAIEMDLRAAGHVLSRDPAVLAATLPEATGKVLVLVHGSSMNDRQWSRDGHDHGAALARDLGYTPVYVRYNSGLHVSANGRSLSDHLDALLKAWPVPVSELTILGHSMGGLVARSACHAAALAKQPWLGALRRLVFLGSPHHGSPLERGGNIVDVVLGWSAYSTPLARLGKIRSAGVTDLRWGNVQDGDWADRGRFTPGRDERVGLALPLGVECFAIAGTLTESPSERPLSDGLVPVDSALGRHERPELALRFPSEHTWIALGTGHLDLLADEAVYAKLRDWLAAAL